MSDLSSIIIGGDSKVGQLLLKSHCFKNSIFSTRRSETLQKKNAFFLDISKSLENNDLPKKSFDIAILAAGVTSLKKCEEDPIRSRYINVDNLTSIGKKMADQGSFLIYLSTNQVHAGDIPCSPPVNEALPISEYGKQKLEAEKRLMDLCGDQLAIIRMSKIIFDDWPLINNWINELRHDREIHAFSDMYMSPITISHVIDTLTAIAANRLRGTHQLSNSKDISYYDFMRKISAQLSLNNNLIKATSAHDMGIAPQLNPAHTTMDISGLQNIVTLQRFSIEEIVEDFCKSLKTKSPFR